MMHNTLPLGAIALLLLVACDGDSSSNGGTEQSLWPAEPPPNSLSPNSQGDISYLKLSNRDPDCAAYVGAYHATVLDIQQSVHYDNTLVITADENFCSFSSNNIPNHDIGANTSTGNDFATRVGPNTLNYVLSVPRHPTKTATASYVQKVGGSITLNGILLNGVDLDMDSAFCFNTEFTTPLQINLGTREQCGLFADWYAIPAANPDYVTLDEYTGHAFSGRYHYHGDNDGLSNVNQAASLGLDSADVDASGSPVIGFAADGFPIYGHYFYDAETNTRRKAISSWITHTSERAAPQGSSDPFPPIATHPRGLFVEDWYYLEGHGDLDECNGMVDAYGNYGYYYTEDYPYGPICNFGAPDPSFTKDKSEYDDGGLN